MGQELTSVLILEATPSVSHCPYSDFTDHGLDEKVTQKNVLGRKEDKTAQWLRNLLSHGPEYS